MYFTLHNLFPFMHVFVCICDLSGFFVSVIIISFHLLFNITHAEYGR